MALATMKDDFIVMLNIFTMGAFYVFNNAVFIFPGCHETLSSKAFVSCIAASAIQASNKGEHAYRDKRLRYADAENDG